VGKEPVSFFDELQAYVLIAILLLVGYLISWIISKIKVVENRMVKIGLQIMTFKAIMIVCSMVYLQFTIVSASHFGTLFKYPGYMTWFQTIISLVSFSTSILVVYFLFWKLYSNREEFSSSEWTERYGFLMENISPTCYDPDEALPMSYFYYPTFLLRRLVFAAIPFLFPFRADLQF